MYRVPHENLHKVWTRARRLTTESFEWFQLLAWFSVSTCVSRQLKIKSSKMKELERRKVIFSKWQNGTGNRTSCQRFWDLSPNCLQRYQAFEGRVKGEKKGDRQISDQTRRNIRNVQQRIARNPKQSVRKIGRDLNIPKSTAHRITQKHQSTLRKNAFLSLRTFWHYVCKWKWNLCKFSCGTLYVRYVIRVSTVCPFHTNSVRPSLYFVRGEQITCLFVRSLFVRCLIYTLPENNSCFSLPSFQK